MSVVGPIALIGPPGSGKTTQGKLLAEKLRVPYFSAGDLFRKEVSDGTETGRYIEPILARGDLVPQWAVREVLDRTIAREDARRGFILDGYPRTVEEAKTLDQLSFIMGWKQVKVIEIKVSHDEIFKRLSTRGRADDSPEVVRHRLEVYEKQTRPVLTYYQTRGQAFSVDGTGEIDEVQSRITEALEEQMPAPLSLARPA